MIITRQVTNKLNTVARRKFLKPDSSALNVIRLRVSNSRARTVQSNLNQGQRVIENLVQILEILIVNFILG